MFSILKKLSQLDSQILEKMRTMAKTPQFLRSSEMDICGVGLSYKKAGEEIELLIKERDQIKEKVSLYIQIAAIAVALINGILALVITLSKS